MPRKLVDLFRLMYSRVHENIHSPFIDGTFRWTLGAKRALTLNELSQAVSIQRGQHRLQHTCATHELLHLINSTRGLLYYDVDEKQVLIVHRSFREFMVTFDDNSDESSAMITAEGLDMEIGHLCMTYLSFQDFQSQLVHVESSQQLTERDVGKAAGRVIPSMRIAIASESRGAGTVLKARERLSSFKSYARSRSSDTHSIEAGLGQMLLKMKEKVRAGASQTVQYPFLEYARTFWFTHVRNTYSKVDQDTWALFSRLAGPTTGLEYDQPWLEPQTLPSAWNVFDYPIERYGFELYTQLLWARQQRHLGHLELTMKQLNVRPNGPPRPRDDGSGDPLSSENEVQPSRSLQLLSVTLPELDEDIAKIVCMYPGLFAESTADQTLLVAMLVAQFDLIDIMTDWAASRTEMMDIFCNKGYTYGELIQYSHLDRLELTNPRIALDSIGPEVDKSVSDVSSPVCFV